MKGESRQTGVLYYAEVEWMSQGEFLYGDILAKLLHDAHIDYDIRPLDSLKEVPCSGEG